MVGIGISLCASAKKTYIKYISGAAYIVIFNLSHYYWNYKNGLKVGFIEKPFYIDEIIVEIISILLGISLCLILKRK